MPATDATVVTRMKQAGAIPLIKTNIPEFSLWWETDNLVHGCSFSSEHMPIGIQLVSRWLDEATILRLGALLESASEVRDRRPAV